MTITKEELIEVYRSNNFTEFKTGVIEELQSNSIKLILSAMVGGIESYKEYQFDEVIKDRIRNGIYLKDDFNFIISKLPKGNENRLVYSMLWQTKNICMLKIKYLDGFITPLISKENIPEDITKSLNKLLSLFQMFNYNTTDLWLVEKGVIMLKENKSLIAYLQRIKEFLQEES